MDIATIVMSAYFAVIIFAGFYVLWREWRQRAEEEKRRIREITDDYMKERKMSEKLKGRYFDVEVKTEGEPYFFLLAKAEHGEVKGELMQQGSYSQLVGLFSIHASAVLKVAKAEGKSIEEACFELTEALMVAKKLVKKGRVEEIIQ